MKKSKKEMKNCISSRRKILQLSRFSLTLERNWDLSRQTMKSSTRRMSAKTQNSMICENNLPNRKKLKIISDQSISLSNSKQGKNSKEICQSILKPKTILGISYFFASTYCGKNISHVFSSSQKELSIQKNSDKTTEIFAQKLWHSNQSVKNLRYSSRILLFLSFIIFIKSIIILNHRLNWKACMKSLKQLLT